MEVELEQDVRIIRRNLAKGFVAPAAVAEMLADLPDVTEQGEWFDPQGEAEAASRATDAAAGRD